MKKLLTITIAIILAMPTKMVPGTIYGARHHLCLRPMAKGVSEETLTADLVDAAELAAIQEQVQQLLAEWDEIFPKQIEAEPASREGSDIFEQDKRVRQAAAPFDDSEWIARGDDKIIEKFFEAHKYEILPIEKRRNITVKYIRQLLEKLHKPWKQIEMDPEDIRDRRGEKIEHPSEKRIATVRHLRQRQHDVTVFDKKVSMLRNLADAKLDTKVKLNLVLNDMIKILKDNAEALFSEQIEEDRIFQYVIRIYVRWVISAIIDYDPIKVSDALMPLLKSEGHQGRKENIETLLLQCIVSMQQKDASLDEQVKVARAIREAEKDSKPLDFLDEMRPVNKLKEIMPKIKIIIDTQWVEGLLEIEAGSTVKDVLLSLGIPVGGEQMIDVIRHGRSVLGARPGRMDVLKKELLRGDNLVVLSEIKAEPENIIKILETTGIIKPDTFQEETQREGLALTVAALGEASFGLLRRMKGMRYRVYKDYDYHIESVDMANIFSELIHRIKRNVGISEAILFLRDFVLQDAEKEGIPRLQNLLAVPFTDDFLKGFLAVLERKDGYEKVCKILSLDIKRYGVPEHEEPSEREALHAEAPETELVFRAIAQKQRQLPKAEFGRWLERYLEHIEIGLWVRKFLVSDTIYLIKEGPDEVLIYRGRDADIGGRWRDVKYFTMFSQMFGFKSLDEAGSFLQLLAANGMDSGRPINVLQANVKFLIESFSYPLAEKIIKGLIEYSEGEKRPGIEFLTADSLDHSRGIYGLERDKDMLTVHFGVRGASFHSERSWHKINADIKGIDIPEAGTARDIHMKRRLFMLEHEVPFTEQDKIGIKLERRNIRGGMHYDTVHLIIDGRTEPAVVWELGKDRKVFVIRPPKISPAAAAIAASALRPKATRLSIAAAEQLICGIFERTTRSAIGTFPAISKRYSRLLAEQIASGRLDLEHARKNFIYPDIHTYNRLSGWSFPQPNELQLQVLESAREFIIRYFDENHIDIPKESREALLGFDLLNNVLMVEDEGLATHGQPMQAACLNIMDTLLLYDTDGEFQLLYNAVHELLHLTFPVSMPIFVKEGITHYLTYRILDRYDRRAAQAYLDGFNETVSVFYEAIIELISRAGEQPVIEAYIKDSLQPFGFDAETVAALRKLEDAERQRAFEPLSVYTKRLSTALGEFRKIMSFACRAAGDGSETEPRSVPKINPDLSLLIAASALRPMAEENNMGRYSAIRYHLGARALLGELAPSPAIDGPVGISELLKMANLPIKPEAFSNNVIGYFVNSNELAASAPEATEHYPREGILGMIKRGLYQLFTAFLSGAIKEIPGEVRFIVVSDKFKDSPKSKKLFGLRHNIFLQLIFQSDARIVNLREAHCKIITERLKKIGFQEVPPELILTSFYADFEIFITEYTLPEENRRMDKETFDLFDKSGIFDKSLLEQAGPEAITEERLHLAAQYKKYVSEGNTLEWLKQVGRGACIVSVDEEQTQDGGLYKQLRRHWRITARNLPKTALVEVETKVDDNGTPRKVKRYCLLVLPINQNWSNRLVKDVMQQLFAKRKFRHVGDEAIVKNVTGYPPGLIPPVPFNTDTPVTVIIDETFKDKDLLVFIPFGEEDKRIFFSLKNLLRAIKLSGVHEVMFAPITEALPAAETKKAERLAKRTRAANAFAKKVIFKNDDGLHARPASHVSRLSSHIQKRFNRFDVVIKLAKVSHDSFREKFRASEQASMVLMGIRNNQEIWVIAEGFLSEDILENIVDIMGELLQDSNALELPLAGSEGPIEYFNKVDRLAERLGMPFEEPLADRKTFRTPAESPNHLLPFATSA